MDLILATAGFDYMIRLWSPHNATCFKKLGHRDSQVNKLDISTDGKHLVAAGHQQIRVYDLASPSPYPSMTYDKLNKNVTSVGFQSLKQWIYTGGEDGLVCIWDIRTAVCQRKLKLPSAVNSVTLHPDQTVLFVGQENTSCSYWDLRQNKEVVIHKNMTKEGSIQSVSVNNIASQLCAIDNKGLLRLWDIKDMSQPKCVTSEQCHLTRGLKCTFSPDCETIATTSSDTTARLWNITEDGIVLDKTFSTPDQKWVWDAVFSTDSQFLFTASSDGTVRLWDSQVAGTPKQEYAAHQKAVVSIAFWDREAANFYSKENSTESES